jgi:hypothetical protein
MTRGSAGRPRNHSTRPLLSLLALTCAIFFMVHPAGAVDRVEAEETARLLAALLDSGRVVIDRNQRLIDDQHKGNKGFTPEVFGQQLRDEFEARTRIGLAHLNAAGIPPMARNLLPMLVEASKSVVGDAQIVINQRGVGYKNFIPATFGSQAAARFSAMSPIRIKQTALQPRNQKNAPDAYEAAVLTLLGTQPGPAIPISEVTDEGRTLRVLTPIYYAKECLKCHGVPAGDLDISGYPKEGAREGDLAGAISVLVPLRDR